jgi:putative sterol carrier protein
MTLQHETVCSEAFWRQVAAAANSDDDFRNRSSHLRDFSFSFQIGDSRIGLQIDQGSLALVIADTPSFVVAGPVEEWSSLVAGAKPYGAAINVVHGKLKVSGDALASTWASRPLWQLFRLTRRIVASGDFNG